MQKLSSSLASLFLLSSLSLFAGKPNAQKTQPAMYQPEGVTTQPQEIITPPVAPRVDHGVVVNLSADFIWWKPYVGGTEYAFTGVADDGTFVPVGSSVGRGHTTKAKFKFEPGFKVGFGLTFAHDGWDAFAEYTWLRTGHQTNHLDSKAGLGESTDFALISVTGAINYQPVSTATSTFQQNFNALDLELGRNFFISRYLTLRPHFGLKGAYISNDFQSSFVGITNSFFLTAESHRRQTVAGLGIRGGVDTVWHFSRNWGFYGNLAVTNLWGSFHPKIKDVTTTTTFGTTTNLNTRKSVQEVVPVIELGLGLSYMTWFNQERCSFLISAGWEEQVWFNFNHFITSDRQGNLSFQGLTVKVAFSF